MKSIGDMVRKTTLALGLIGSLALGGCAATMATGSDRYVNEYQESRYAKRVTPLVVQEKEKNSWGSTGDWLSLIGLAGMLDKDSKNDAAGRIAYEAGNDMQERDVANLGGTNINLSLNQRREQEIQKHVRIMQDEEGNIFPFQGYIWAYPTDPNGFSVIKTVNNHSANFSYTYLNFHDEDNDNAHEWKNGEVEGIRDVYKMGEPVKISFQYLTQDAQGSKLKIRLYGPKSNLLYQDETLGDAFGHIVFYDLKIARANLSEEGTYTAKWFDAQGNFLHDHSFGIVK